MAIENHPEKLAEYLSSGTVWVTATRAVPRDIGLVFIERCQDREEYALSFLFAPAHWGNGYATEAIGALLSKMRQMPGIRRVTAQTQSANTASCLLLGRLGFIEASREHRFEAEQINFVLGA